MMTHRDIVVIGASVGGLEALKILIAGLPADFPAAVLVVVHTSPHSPNYTHTILARSGTLPVTNAEDGEALIPSHIYVAPPDRHLLLGSGAIRVTRGPKENRSRPAVDALFRSAAQNFGPRVIGIVLTGNLDDGTAGLWAIKDCGGTALVQAPNDAEYPSMPESALKHVAVDYTLPVADMPRLLVELTRKPVNVPQPVSLDKLRIETSIALEGNGLKEGVMKLGDISPNTCPECHGVLVRIKEGSIIRYRCHTGHAYSLETLLAEVNEEIDITLVSAMRAIEERILLLDEMENTAREQQDIVHAKKWEQQKQVTEEYVQAVRELVLSHNLFGKIEVSG
jgi:two-component system, chemotaxis family, protein-glutamate methylesterase/glutaminase